MLILFNNTKKTATPATERRYIHVISHSYKSQSDITAVFFATRVNLIETLSNLTTS